MPTTRARPMSTAASRHERKFDQPLISVRPSGLPRIHARPLAALAWRRLRRRAQSDDDPVSIKQIHLRVITRRFVCEAPDFRRQIFAERYGDDALPTRSRRTAQLEYIVHHLGLALGGRPAASFARRLMLPVSKDTLLRVVRRRTAPRGDPLTVVSVDDWAFSTQSSVRNDCLRSRAAADREALARSRGRNSSGLARRASRDQDRVSRSW